MPQLYDIIKSYIRVQEAKYKITPTSIKLKNDTIIISMKKQAFYECRASYSHQFGTYKVKENLDFSFHQAAIEQLLLAHHLSDAVVTIRHQRKTFPIPFLNIPIPFTKRKANQVRRADKQTSNDTAVQPIRIEIRLPISGISNAHNLWIALNRLMMMHTSNRTGAIIDTSLAARRTHNPFKWLARLVSPLLPKITGQILPNYFVSIGRVNQMGTPFAKRVTSLPVSDSGVGAQLLNVTSVMAITGGVVGVIAYTCMEELGENSTSSNDISSGVGRAMSSSSSIMNWFAADRSEINMDELEQGVLAGHCHNACVRFEDFERTDFSMNATFTNDATPQQSRSKISKSGMMFFATRARVNRNSYQQTLPSLYLFSKSKETSEHSTPKSTPSSPPEVELNFVPIDGSII